VPLGGMNGVGPLGVLNRGLVLNPLGSIDKSYSEGKLFLFG
jgi:hypothetical protein